MASAQKKIQHLFLRAGFGETPSRINSLVNAPVNALVDGLFTASQEYKDIDYLPYPITENEENKGVGGFKLIKMFLKSYGDMEELNGEWIFKMAYTPAVLREKMTFFWHNHFSTSTPLAYLMQVQNNTLRQYALGKFGDLLHAVAKDPAMILYLNNQQNKKAHPNENFAREVMELFTLGVGHYTEKDIKEGARAFTGWEVNNKGEFVFNEKVHDFDEKEFLGQKGNFSGDDILNIILSNKQVAVFVVTKIYREFVNPNVNTDRVNELAEAFFKSGYDISALMKGIFKSDWFYDDENIGAKVISPVELLVRYKKLVNVDTTNKKTLVDLQKALGQVLFFPPNVGGWKGGNTWIDSSSLLLRLSIPLYVIRGEGLILKAKPHPEETPDETVPETDGERGKITSDWNDLNSAFKDIPAEKQMDVMLEYFIQCDTSRIDRNLLKTSWTNSDKDNLTLSIAAIMSLPEFQLI
ncbi:MAG TPA: DUF1800 domain-containing protein [Bacteroidia bacterium]|nr:DUF1800 domain-containing protein [Bacteroidia bacterium]